MDLYKKYFTAIKKVSLSVIWRVLRYSLILWISPIIPLLFIGILMTVLGYRETPFWYNTLLCITSETAFLAWQAFFVFNDDGTKRAYLEKLEKNEIGDSYVECLKFSIKCHHTLTDLVALFFYLMTFGKNYLPLAMLIDKKSIDYFPALFSSLLIILFIPSAIMMVFLRALSLYKSAPYLELCQFESVNTKKQILRFLKNFFIWGVIYILGPAVLVGFIAALYVIFGLMLNYIEYCIAAVILYYAVVFVRAVIKRKKLTKALNKVTKENGAKIKKSLFAYIPNLFFPNLTYKIEKDGKTYHAYTITVLSYRTLIRFYPGMKYVYGIRDISEISKKEVGIPLTIPFKIKFKKIADENHTNVVVINPSCKFLDIKEGKVRRLTDLDIIYGTQILSGSSLVQSLDRVFRGVHDFSGSGKFKY